MSQIQPSSQHYLPSISAGFINGMLIVIFQSAYAALIFSGPLSAFVPAGTGYMLLGAMVMGLTVALTSSFYGTVTAPQDAPTAIFAIVAAAICLQTPGDTAFLTVIAAMALTAIFTGVCLLLLGWFKLGNLIRFIPYPVVGGFLAGTGWILVKGSIGIMADLSLSIDNVDLLFLPGYLVKWLPGLIFAVSLFFVLKKFRHFLLMPGLIFATIILFYVLLFASGADINDARNNAWLPAAFPDGVTWRPISAELFAAVNWSAILGQAGTLSTIVVISIISLLLNASGLELIARQEIDLNRELRSTGLANLLSGAGGSAVGYMSLSLSAFGFRLGSRKRLSGLVSAGMCGLALISGAGISAYFPKPLLGGLLLYLGLTFLIDWLYEAWFKLPRSEYFLVVLILLTIGMAGFLEGMVVGTLIAVILFAINYSRVDVIKHALSGVNFQSNVDRALPFQRILRESGEQLYILKLQGFLFFGTANSILDEMKRRANDESLPSLRYVILDFSLVSGLDSSALNSFEKMKLLAENLDVVLVLTDLSTALQQRLGLEITNSDANGHLREFPDLDRGVEWAENEIIRESADESTSSGARLRHQSAAAFIEAILSLSSTELDEPEAVAEAAVKLMDYLQRKEVGAGRHLINHGREAEGLYIILSGKVTAQIDRPDGSSLRLRTMSEGTVVGEMSTYLGTPASASVVTNEACTVLHLTLDNLRAMEAQQPRVAAVFHRYIVRVLGDRLTNNNKTLQALLRK